jgi:predicted metalloprotease
VKTKLLVVMASIMLLVAGCATQKMDGRYEALPPQAAPSSLMRADFSDSAFMMDCPVGEEDGDYGSCVPCKDYEGCFTKSADMRYFFTLIVKWIREYSADTYQSMPDVDAWHFVTLGESGPEGCTDASGRRAAFTDESYEYCPLDHVVYVGEQQMWDFYTYLGDAAPAVGIAHEWSHHLQAVAGLTSTTQSETIALEDQADCVAGAWSKWLVAKQIMGEDDFGDIGALLVAIGSIEGPNRDHGTSEERQDSFLVGLDGGLAACNDYAPDNPIITG